MMEKKDFTLIMELIESLYPDKFKLTEGIMKGWYICLKDLDRTDLWKAAIAHAKENKYPPTIAELREYCEENAPKKINPYTLYSDTAAYHPDYSSDENARELFKKRLAELPEERKENFANQLRHEINTHVRSVEKGEISELKSLTELIEEFNYV